MALPLPSFRKPPVIEVAIAAQFRPLESLTSPLMGLLWERYRDSFPNLEVHPTLEPRFERSGPALPPKFRIEIEEIPTHRVWFVTDDRSLLIQIQRDRFVFNWRKIPGQDYPRYERVRKAFEEHYDAFQEFLATEGLGHLRLNQWEITYINHIELTNGRHGDLSAVAPLLIGRMNNTFLPDPEDIMLQARYRIPHEEAPSLSRLHITAMPALTNVADTAAFNLTLTARGNLRQGDSLLEQLGVGRAWIVWGFTEVTSPMMHQLWERER